MSKNLLHFTHANTAIDYILKNKTIRMQSFKNVNDPKESKEWSFKLFCFFKENKKLYNKQLFEKLHSYIMNHIFISCFSVQEHDGNYLDNYEHDLRMWSQYGNNHKGVCIVFDKDKLENLIKENTDGSNFYHDSITYINSLSDKSYNNPPYEAKGFFFFNKFIYLFAHSMLHPYARPQNQDPYMVNIERLHRLGISEYMKQHIKYYSKDLLFTKNKCWQDEREYRYIIHSSKEREYIDIPISNSIKSIILGNDFPNELLDRILELSHQLNFKIYKLITRGWHNHVFELIHKSLNENDVSINSNHPINFYYQELYSTVCDIKGNIRVLNINSDTGEVRLID